MKSFQNLNPGLKLTAGFGLCLALAALVGGMALTRMAVIANTAEAMRAETITGLKSLSAFHSNARRLRTLEMEHALAPVADQPALESDMGVAIAAAQAGLHEYVQSVRDPVDRRNCQKLRSAWTRYLAMHHRELVIAHQYPSQQTYAELSGPMRTQFLSVRDLCNMMTNWNDAHSRWYGRQIRSVYTQSQAWVVALLLLAVGGGAGIACLITRHMTRALRDLESEIADREKAEAQSNAGERRFRALVTHSADVFAILDADGIRRYVSPAVENIWGYAPDRVVGTHTLNNVHPEDRARACAVLEQVLASPYGEGFTEVRLRHADGSWRPAEILVHNRLSDPDVCGLILTCRDVTARRHYEEQLRHQAFHDQLTGLPNRDLLLDRLDHALARSDRHDTRPAVVFIDLDNFKVINDSLGHGAGDVLLLTVAERMKACVRAEDTVARFGGDEFAILLESVNAIEAVDTADRILAALRPALHIGSRDVFITASIGVATSSDTDSDAGSLLRDADVAMYQAKSHGKAGCAIFNRSMSDHATERMELEADLRRAIDEGQMRLHYQPIVSLETGKITEVEALVRWEHPNRGLIPPLKFIPIAEETGLIVPLGHWVLEEACRQACEWQTNQLGQSPLIVGVNLSTRQFRQEDLLEDVAAILEKTGLPPSCLKLEITESLMATDTDATIAKLHRLKDLGVHLAVDDFGTGYSSMSYLANFPVDTLKIDRSFVQRIGEGAEAEAILQAILSLAKALGLRVTSEGIETHEQRTLLQTMGCDRGQGYLFSRPVPGADLAVLLATEKAEMYPRDAQQAA